MKPVPMRMAKATPEDILAMFTLIGMLSDVFETRSFENPQFPRKSDGSWDETDPDYFDPDDKEHLSILFDRLKSVIAPNLGAMNRVVWGFETLVSEKNALIDPDVDHLALHPRFAAMQDALEQIEDLRSRDRMDMSAACCSTLAAETLKKFQPAPTDGQG